MPDKENGVGTEKQEVVEKKQDDLEVLMNDGRKYPVKDKVFTQRALVLKDFTRLMEHIFELMGTIAQVEPELLKADNLNEITPQRLAAMAGVSGQCADTIYNIIAMVLEADKEFIVNNMDLKTFSKVLADAFELNDIGEVIRNFQRAAHQVRQYLQSKK